MPKFLDFREKYPTFIYHDYQITQDHNHLCLTYHFEIVGLSDFYPTLEIPIEKEVDCNSSFLKYLVFHIGLVEMISYYKLTCSPVIEIRSGYLNEEQKSWFQKLIYHGLGEFRYVNDISISKEELVEIEVKQEEEKIEYPTYHGEGNLIPVGGGKDSCVTLELLKEEKNTCFILNPKQVTLDCARIANEEAIGAKRTLDKKMLELNKEGFLNGHTPFSTLLAFVSFLVSYLYHKKYIVLSNEASANEVTVIGSDINHQYSKTYEFENDFNQYTKKYFKIDIHYFSLLRPLSELQIGLLFSNYKKYHSIFKSCNVGSKENPWKWCCHCSKCLFVYIILSPFLSKEELISIFHEDLLDKKELLEIFLELLGYRDTKPFECVGTIEDVRSAICLTLKRRKDAYLLNYYLEHYPMLKNINFDYFNEENNVPEQFIKILRSELQDARENYSISEK